MLRFSSPFPHQSNALSLLFRAKPDRNPTRSKILGIIRALNLDMQPVACSPIGMR
jgi:hypothetical protein